LLGQQRARLGQIAVRFQLRNAVYEIRVGREYRPPEGRQEQ
jgi:hypothetical protein